MSTTIQVNEETRDKIKSFGTKGETYDHILLRLYDTAVKDQLRDLLMSSHNTISLKEARERHRKRWSKSR